MVPWKSPGNPIAPFSQSITCSSSSAAAGDVSHFIPCTPIAAVIISAINEGSEIGEETRTLPMGDPRQQKLIKILNNPGYILPFRRHGIGQLLEYFTRLH